MKNCISVADVQMCWIVYSSHDTSSAYQREIFVQIQTFGRKQLHNHPGALVPNQEFLRSHCGILNGRIIRNSIESAIGVLQGFYYFSFLFKFKISFFLFLIWRLRCQSGWYHFKLPVSYFSFESSVNAAGIVGRNQLIEWERRCPAQSHPLAGISWLPLKNFRQLADWAACSCSWQRWREGSKKWVWIGLNPVEQSI